MKIYDVTLRDGCHAINHQLTKTQIIEYCTRIDDCGVDFVEVGHGIGLGASSLLIGKSLLSDVEMLKTARAHLQKSKLSVHTVPGYGTIDNIKEALDCGVNTFRVATHCSEADTAERHINFLRGINAEVVSGLMMAHMISPEDLLFLAKKLERGFKSVNDDVKLLKRFGFVDLIKERENNRDRYRPEIIVDTVTINIRV